MCQCQGPARGEMYGSLMPSPGGVMPYNRSPFAVTSGSVYPGGIMAYADSPFDYEDRGISGTLEPGGVYVETPRRSGSGGWPSLAAVAVTVLAAYGVATLVARKR